MITSDFWDDSIYQPLPFHMREGIKMWILHGNRIRLGDFMYAVLTNDLTQAVARADDINIQNLDTWVRWLHCYAPVECWGSPERVRTWKGIEHDRPADTDANAAGADHLRSTEQSADR